MTRGDEPHRMRRLALTLLVAMALLAASPAAAAPRVGGAIQGAGTVSTYYIVTGGFYAEGGAFDANFACYGCYVRLTIESGTYELAQNGAVVELAPGTYQISGFVGYIGITTNGLHDFFLEIHGEGAVDPWSP